MKRLMKPAVVLTAVCALALSPLTSVNAEPKVQDRGEATFTFVFGAPAALEGTVEGCFAVEGAIKDCGTASEAYSLVFDPVEEVWNATGTKTIEGRRGTITMEFSAVLTGLPLPAVGQAQWEIIGGTGAYKKIRGSGGGSVWIEFSDMTLRGSYTGDITKDPSLE